MTPSQLAQQIRSAATEEGFAACGITGAIASPGFPDLVRWIESGYASGMEYFPNRLDAYRHPDSILPGAKSLIVLAMPYDASTAHEPTDALKPEGRVGRYAWSGVDYHDTIHSKLKKLCQTIHEWAPEAKSRGVVDTAPLMEREVAQLAGLGWRGKNTLLLNRTLGSYFFLACVLVDLELPTDEPHVTSHCGTCTACLDACPTDAFPAAGVLDASRCISYLTIEHRDMIPASLREGIGDWVFGCDVCQEVCPWNRKPSRRADTLLDSVSLTGPNTRKEIPELDQRQTTLDLISLFQLDDDSFRQRFRKSPMWRTRRRGLLRNAAIVLGNLRAQSASEVLLQGLHDDEAIVRAACVWALRRIVRSTEEQLTIDQPTVDLALDQLRQRESNEAVLAELEMGCDAG